MAGISDAYRRELIGLMDDLMGTEGLDAAIARQAAWLKMGLEGRAPSTTTIMR